MLERLDTIDWTNVHQAFGDGTQFPAAIRDLTSPDPQVRDKAFMRIDNYAIVQGALSEAAAVVIPFLTEIVAEPGANGKADALHLLFEFACGYPRITVNSENDRVWAAAKGLDFAEMVRMAEAEYRDTRRALAEGIPVYCKALETSDPDVRLGAADLLSVLPEAMDIATDSLLAACEREIDPYRRASVIGCFGDLFESHGTGAERLEQWMLHPFSEVDEAAAAEALARVVGEKTPEAAVDILVRAMRVAWPDQPPHCPGANVTFPLAALLALRVPRGVEAVIRCLKQPRNWREAHWMTKELLNLSFGGGGYTIEKEELWHWNPKPRVRYRKVAGSAAQPSPLSDLQRRALVAILGCDKLWEVDSNLLEMFGFPVDRAELGRLLASK